MKLICIFLLISSSSVFGQRVLPLDSTKVKEVSVLLADDYGSLYFYRNKDFSFAKYDSVGTRLGELRLTVPYKIQDIQNALKLVLFSENAQEVKLLDQNLTEIQRISLTRFGFIKMAFVEDQQQMWLLDESTKRLLQFRFRTDDVLQAFPVPFKIEEVKDMIVYNQKIYLLMDHKLEVYSLKGILLFSTPVLNSKRLRRENEEILILSQNKIVKMDVNFELTTLFSSEEARIVDKNNSTFFELRDNKIYLYPLQEKYNTEAK